MRKKIEHIYCDRCKKEIAEKNHVVYYSCYAYELCDNCFNDFNEFKIKVNELDEQYKNLAKQYKFGEYLPDERKGD